MNIGKGDSLKNANEIKGNPIKYNVENKKCIDISSY